MSARITVLESHDRVLRDHFEAHKGGHERAAVVLFRRLSVTVPGLADSDRFVSVEVLPFLDEWITSSSSTHVAFETRNLREFFRRCKEEALVFGFVHNHPTGFADFSQIDEDNERTLLQALTNRNGAETSLVALVLINGAWKGRVRHGRHPEVPRRARHVIVPGRPVQVHAMEARVADDAFLARQVAAFGRPFVCMMSSLRAAVVGAGGTGSPTVTLLARSGIGELVLIDPDRLERSNLNRVRGARAADVGENKAAILGC